MRSHPSFTKLPSGSINTGLRGLMRTIPTPTTLRVSAYHSVIVMVSDLSPTRWFVKCVHVLSITQPHNSASRLSILNDVMLQEYDK